jgi:hypothetical protein
MHNPVAHGCFVDLPLFWVMDSEPLIGLVLVAAELQSIVQHGQVGLQIFLVILYISTRFFTARKFPPGCRECFNGSNIF